MARHDDFENTSKSLDIFLVLDCNHAFEKRKVKIYFQTYSRCIPFGPQFDTEKLNPVFFEFRKLASSFIVLSPLNLNNEFNREVAQVVAHLVWDQRVAGSNPVFPTLSTLRAPQKKARRT